MSLTRSARFDAISRTAVLRGGPFDAQTREVLGWPKLVRIPEWSEANPSRVVAIHVYTPGPELGPTAREYVHDRRDDLT